MEEKPPARLELGLLHYYYGNGCGKTSIAMGHILRCLGRQMRPVMIQFLKKHDPTGQEGFFYGEYITLTEVLHVPVFQYGSFHFIVSKDQIDDRCRENAAEGIQKLKDIFASDKFDLVILDEVINAATLKIIDLEQLKIILQSRPPTIEVIMTGREKIPEMLELADYVTHLEEIKHPYQKGIQARAGIEY